MSYVTYGIAGGFTNEQLRGIHNDAIRVLERVGMKVTHPKLLEILAASNGIEIRDHAVTFSRETCEKYLNFFRKEEAARVPYADWKIEGPWYAGKIVDLESSEIRDPLSADVVAAVRLCSALEILRPVCPLAPKDVPPAVEAITAWKIALENSAGMGGAPLTNPVEIECAVEMASAAGRKGPVWCTEVTKSPLTINSEAIDLIFKFMDKDMAVHGEPGPMLSAGCTAPVFAPAFFVQALAEWLGAYMVLKIMSNGELGNSSKFRTSFNGGLRFEPMHFDMQTSSVAYGSSESMLFRMAARQIFRFLGSNEETGGAFRTTAKQIDAQAVAERSMNVLAEALDGARVFIGAGVLAVDGMFSPELLLVDREIVRYVQRVVEGMTFRAGTDESCGIIEETGFEENYLAHETTVRDVRKSFYYSALFDHSSLAQWSASGSTTFADKTRTVAREALREYDFSLDENTRREIERIHAIYSDRLMNE